MAGKNLRVVVAGLAAIVLSQSPNLNSKSIARESSKPIEIAKILDIDTSSSTILDVNPSQDTRPKKEKAPSRMPAGKERRIIHPSGWLPGPEGTSLDSVDDVLKGLIGCDARIGGGWHAKRKGHLHEGVDIFAKEGCPIYAFEGGIVVKVAFQKKGAGNYLKIDHDATGILPPPNVAFQTAYMHCSRIAVETNQIVHKGDVIAYVGRTGYTGKTPSHLHFEIREEGGSKKRGNYHAVDPKKFIGEKYIPTGNYRKMHRIYELPFEPSSRR